MARDWKKRGGIPRWVAPPVGSVTPEELKAQQAAYDAQAVAWCAEEDALLAEAIGEISKIVLSFGADDRHKLAQLLAVLGPEPEDEDKRDPWLEALEGIKQLGLGYIALSQQDRTKQDCPDCAKPKPARVVRAPANVVVELTDEELQHLARKFGAQYVQAAIEEINALRDAGDEPEDEKKA